jgi:hypothetical protein
MPEIVAKSAQEVRVTKELELEVSRGQLNSFYLKSLQESAISFFTENETFSDFFTRPIVAIDRQIDR